MGAIESVVVASTATMPPARDIDGALTRARKVPILDLHAFTSAGANAEAAASPSSNLPPPEKWVLIRMGDVQVTEMIERHIEFVDENDRSVHLPSHFVRHFMRREDSLPFMVAIAQLPIVLADGNLLAGNGLDRARGIFFAIPKELTAIVPVSKERAQARSRERDEVSLRRVAVRRCHRLHRQVRHHRRRAHRDRALVTAGPAGLLSHRRTARHRQNDHDHHVAHPANRKPTGGRHLVER